VVIFGDIDNYYFLLFSFFIKVHGLVPIVEPDILCDGDHTIDKCQEVMFYFLFAQKWFNYTENAKQLSCFILKRFFQNILVRSKLLYFELMKTIVYLIQHITDNIGNEDSVL
jgi:hypothetical protein